MLCETASDLENTIISLLGWECTEVVAHASMLQHFEGGRFLVRFQSSWKGFQTFVSILAHLSAEAKDGRHGCCAPKPVAVQIQGENLSMCKAVHISTENAGILTPLQNIKRVARHNPEPEAIKTALLQKKLSVE